jgi:hypothetical protein
LVEAEVVEEEEAEEAEEAVDLKEIKMNGFQSPNSEGL